MPFRLSRIPVDRAVGELLRRWPEKSEIAEKLPGSMRTWRKVIAFLPRVFPSGNESLVASVEHARSTSENIGTRKLRAAGLGLRRFTSVPVNRSVNIYICVNIRPGVNIASHTHSYIPRSGYTSRVSSTVSTVAFRLFYCRFRQRPAINGSFADVRKVTYFRVSCAAVLYVNIARGDSCTI